MAESSRLNTGYVRTVLTRRGLSIDDDERLRNLLRAINPTYSEKLRAALVRMSSGVETPDDVEMVSSVTFAVSRRTAEVMRSAGYKSVTEADLLEWYGSGGRLALASSAAAGDEDAKRQLATRFGAPYVQTVEADARLSVATEKHVSSSEVQMPRRVRGARKSTWVADDRAKSFARDQDSVKAMPASKHKVFASRAAVTFEIDLLRTPEYGRKYTVRVEGASKDGDDGGYDWTNKMVFQLDARELHLAAVVMLGWRSEFLARHHGEARDKSLELKRQAGGVAVNLRMTGRSVLVPMDEEALYKVALLFIRALHLNDWDMDKSTLLNTLKLTAAVAGGSTK